eukprot:g3557.t1
MEINSFYLAEFSYLVLCDFSQPVCILKYILVLHQNEIQASLSYLLARHSTKCLNLSRVTRYITSLKSKNLWFSETVWVTEICDDYVKRNELTVNRPLLIELKQNNTSLQKVVGCLEDGDSLTFSGPLIAVETLHIHSRIRIQGSHEETTSISCIDGPVFVVNGTDVDINDLEIRDCQLETEDAPVTVTFGGSLQLNSVNLTNNTNVGGSAALRIDEGAQLSVEDCNFRRNGGIRAHGILAGPNTDITVERSVFRFNSGNGSAIYISDGSSLTVSNSRLVNNRADLAGGALIINSPREATTVIIEEGSEFRGNEAHTGEGGAIVAIGNVSLTITEDTIFSRNVAGLQGGALFFSGHSTLTIQDAFFVENESNFSGGGAIYAQNSMNKNLDIQISNTIFSKNAATNQLGSGGAIRLHGSRITCNIERGVSFISNVAELDGAAIHISDGPEVNISAASFVGNEVYQGGGAAIYASSVDHGSITYAMIIRMISSKFLQNKAIHGIRGGGTLGFTSRAIVVYIEKCEFNENEAMFGTGGVFHIFEGPVLNSRKSSFIDNKAAIQGGVIYGQVEASVDMSDCIFHRNAAAEGGAISARGAINVDIVESDLRNNSAKEDGGAIRAENHAYSGGNRARLTITNSSFVNNNAGFEMRQGGIDSQVTRGGGIAAIGAGQYVDIKHTTFRNNSASEGGALAAIEVRHLLLYRRPCFEMNAAIFGGAAYVLVDNNVADDVFEGSHNISGARFINNTASSEGGAVRVGSSTSANDFFPINADRRTLVFENCTFINNSAANTGGGLTVTGVGLELINMFFAKNTAMLNGVSSTLGSGGGIAVTDGASVRLIDSSIQDNIAHLAGGGLFVMDSSVTIQYSEFLRNSVNAGTGNGGAVALNLTWNRLIPTFTGGAFIRSILFESINCNFIRNSASLHGGAIYHYNSDPFANLTKLNCNAEQVQEAENIQILRGRRLSCERTNSIRQQLQSRVIRLTGVLFESNTAQSGGALFTNHPDMIRITNGNTWSLGNSFIATAQNNHNFKESGIIFKNNSKERDGYGADIASYPVRACFLRGKTCSSKMLTVDDFRMGNLLTFSLRFSDAFNESVTRLDGFEATLRFARNNSSNVFLDGQTTARTDYGGYMNFTAAKPQGLINIPYNLTLSFSYGALRLKMEEKLYINITIRSCRIGQELRTSQQSISCEDCGVGQFNANPEKSDCVSCQHVEGGICLGVAAVPRDHYWHTSSLSMKMYRCIGQEACNYYGRFENVNKTEYPAHMNNAIVSYSTNGNTVQCAPGYRGILCGSCIRGYSREGENCRECAPKGLGYFLLLMLILWSIVFVGYFIRSILQVSKRIEFSKKTGRQSTRSPSNQSTRIEQLPDVSMEPIIYPLDKEDPEIWTDEVEYLPLNRSFFSREFISDTMHEEMTSFTSFGLHTTRKKMERARNSQVIQTRSSYRFRKNSRSVSNLLSSASRRRASLNARLSKLKRNPSSVSVKQSKCANLLSEVLKVLINFLQVTSVAVSINMKWSKAVRGTLIAIGSAANLGTGSGFFSLDCFLKTGALKKSLKRMILTTLFPLVLFLFFVAFWKIYSQVKKQTLKYFLQRSWLTFIAVVYFFYIGMTKNLLRFFACVRIDEDGHSSEDYNMTITLNGYYWEEDTDVQCYKDSHALTVIILVIPLLCIVTIGFPLGTFIILQLNAKHLEDEDVIGTYGFLYQAYDRHYWEIIIMLRKTSIATIVVFVYTLRANMQGLLCVLVLVVSLSLQLSFVPFKKEMGRLNYLETCSLSASISVFVSGLMFNDQVTNSASEIFLSIFSILCVVGTLVWILTNLFLSGEEVMDMKLLELHLMNQDELLNQRSTAKLRVLLFHYYEAAKNLVPFRKTNVDSKNTLDTSPDQSVQMADQTEAQSV